MANLRSLEVLAELPVELVRIILESAAIESTSTACTLVRVSKGVHGWILPLIYRTVIIRRPSQLFAFLDSGSQHFLRHTDRFAIMWEEDLVNIGEQGLWHPHTDEALSDLIARSEKLRSLLIIEYELPPVGPSPSVTEVHYIHWRPPFNTFSNVTHLHLGALPWNWSLWSPVVYAPLVKRGEVPRLSHISFSVMEVHECDPSQPESVRGIITALLLRPLIRVVTVILVQGIEFTPLPQSIVTVPIRRDLETIADPRFLLLSEHADHSSEARVQRWMQGSRGEETFWEEAERVLSRRLTQNSS